MAIGDNKTDPQDPLPESNWFWRRAFSFLVTAALLYFLWGEVDRIGRVALVEPGQGLISLLTVAKWTVSFAGLVVTYYMLAPSAEQITKMIHTAALLRSGVQIASRQVTRDADGSTTDSAATVAKPPQPVVPPAAGDDVPMPDTPDTPDEPDDTGDDDLPPASKSLDVSGVVKGADNGAS